MKRLKLKPHVHKVKGARNCSLYDILTGKFFVIEPGQDMETLSQSLLENELAFETEGIVPFKANLSLEKELEQIQIRSLQVRLNGFPEDNCWNRRKIDNTLRFFSMHRLSLLKEQVAHLPINHIRVQAAVYEPLKVQFILEQFLFRTMSIQVDEPVSHETQQSLANRVAKTQKVSVISPGGQDMKALDIGIYPFFYAQHFNPCLGQQIALDCGGEIKPCLWFKDALGNIEKNRLVELIMQRKFDSYWYLSKDKIEVCKDCEKRYVCKDCRLSHPACLTGETGGWLTQKPSYCHYNPYKGIDDDVLE